MTDAQSESLNLSDAVLIDGLCDDFEAAYGGEPKPQIEDFLTRSPARLRRHSLRHLVSLEIELRRRHGEKPKPSDYYARFPGEEAYILAAWVPDVRANPQGVVTSHTELHKREFSPAAHSVVLPAQFGSYELLTEIGRGGMGVVFLARQAGLNKMVALKTILAGELAMPEDVQRFYSEARSAAQLDHPHIVPVFEVGEHQGQHFYSMGYVEGHSLAEQLKSGPLAPQEIARLVQTIAAAVQYAHEKGIVHRDLKPANILLDTEGRPRITDFGLAKRLTETNGLTATGQPIGTLEYMPPEQALGETAQPSPQADVYSLGAILYRSLTGRPPFQAASYNDALQQVISHEPVPPRRLNPEIPLDLETICLACLEKNPARRYGTARELADELGRYLRGEPIRRRRITRFERGARWCRRNPAIAGLLSVSALLLVALVAASLTGYLVAKERQRKAEISATKEKVAADEAKRQKEAADRAGQLEREQRQRAEDGSYANKIGLAYQRWLSGDVRGAESLLGECPPELRHWEWSYLKRLCHLDLLTIHGVNGGTGLAMQPGLAFTDDGKCVRAYGREWDIDTGQATVRSDNDPASASPTVTGPELGPPKPPWELAVGSNRNMGNRVSAMTLFSPDNRWVVVALTTDPSLPATLSTEESSEPRENPSEGFFSGQNVSGGMVMPSPAAEPSGQNQMHQESVVPGLSGSMSPSPVQPPAATGAGLMPPGGGFLSLGHPKTDEAVAPNVGSDTNAIREQPNNTPGSAGPSTADVGERFSGISVWEVATKTRKAHMEGAASCLAFSADSQFLAWGDNHNAVRVLEVASGTICCTLPENKNPVHCLAFSGDNAMLAVGGSDQAVSIWQLAAKKRFLDLKDHRRVPHTLRFSPDGKTLISLSATELRVWDTTSGVLLRRIDARNHIPSGLIGHDMARMGPNQGESGNSSYDPQEVRSMLALSPDGRKLVSCDFRFIRIWDVSKGLEMLTLRGHAYPIVAAAFNADSSQIVSVDSEGTLKLWDAESPGEWLVRPVLQGVSDISRDGRILVTGVASQTSEQVTSPDDATYVPRPAVDAVEVWQTVTGRLTSRIPLSEQPDFCRRLTLSPSGRYLTIRSDRGARLVKCCDGQEVCRVPADGHDEDKPTYTNFVFSPDERWLAVANYNGSGLWNLAQGRLVYSAGDWAVESFSPDSRRFAARSLLRARAEREEVRVLTADDMNGTLPPSPPKPKPEGPWIGVFDTETGKQTHGWVQRDAHFSGWGPEGVYFAPTGDKLVLWTGWGENRFWDLATGQEHTMHDFSGQDVSYGSDGKDVAVGDLWETARVLDMQSGRCTHLLCSDSDIDMHQQILSDGSVGAVEADPSPCLKVGLTPDNRRLMTASTLGGSIRFWNTKNYQSIVNFGVYDSAAMRDPGGIRMSENLLTVSLGANDAIVLHAFPKRMAGLGIPAEAVWRREVALLFLNESPRIETQFSPDGRWLAVPMSNSRYGGFAIHDASDGRLVVQIPETGANAAFSPDGRYFAVTVPAAQIALWEIARGWTVQPHHLVSLKVGNDNDPSRLLNTSLAFSPDGKWLAVDHCLWECPELRQVAQMDLPSDVCVFDQHGQIYAIRLGEKTVFGAKKPQDAVVLSHRPAAEIKNSPPPSPAAGLPFAQIPSGRETSRKWDEQQQAELGRWEELVKSGNDMWTIADDVLSIRETAGGPTTTFCVTAGRLLSVAPDGRWVAIASGASDSFGSGVAADEQVTGRPPLVAFDRKTKQARNLLTEKELAVVRLESSADGRYLLAWTSCGQSPLHPDDPGYEESLLSNALARLFDMNEYREVSFAEDASVATGFSHDGRRLAWANDSGEIHVFDLASREIVARLAGHSSYVNSLRFSPDDRLIATASDDRTIRLWDLGEGKEAAVIPDHDGAVSWAEFNADGSRLASYALDGTLRLWDVKYLLAKPVAPKWLEAPTFPNDDQIEQLLPSAGNGEGQKSTAGKAAPAEPPEKARPQAADDSLDRKVVIAMLQQGVRILVTTETPGNRGSADGPWDFDGLPPGCAFVSQETELPAQAFRLVGIDAPQLLGKETIESLNGAESLRYLTLRNFQGGKEIGESLARLRALRGLSLFESGCTDEQFQCLAGLRQLESLSIQRTSVGDPSMKLIAGFINLRVLVVNDTPITDAGFESLKSLKSLEALHATGTLLKGSGFVAFESLPALHTLHLSVSRGIDDQALAIIGRLRNLRTLGLAGTSVSAQGVARLRAELPKCRFVLDTQLEEQVNKLTGSPPAGDGSDSDCR